MTENFRERGEKKELKNKEDLGELSGVRRGENMKGGGEVLKN